LLRFGGIAPNSWQAFSVPLKVQKKNQTTKKKHIAKRRIIKNKRRVKRIKFKLNQVKLDEKRCRFWPTF